MTELETILTKYNFPKKKTRPTTTLPELENQIGLTLPDDYKFYLEFFMGHEEFVGSEFVSLWDIDILLLRNKNAGILTNLPLTLGIGNNASSEFIAIEFIDTRNYRIVLSPLIDLDKQYHIEIGNSFTDFLARLDKGKKWFD